ncbi:Uncharacterised protein [Vibrio cholerae]|nr:Uncharacterised protein [Vibrio cholerae]
MNKPHNSYGRASSLVFLTPPIHKQLVRYKIYSPRAIFLRKLPWLHKLVTTHGFTHQRQPWITSIAKLL